MKNMLRRPVVVAGLIALVTLMIVSTAGQYFPHAAKRVTEWQADAIERPKPHPAITIVNMNPQDAGSCGKDSWDRTVLAHTITALSQAEAKAIGPLLPLAGPSPSACGGAASDAQLIEATTLSGRVIYPASAFEPLKNQALEVGYIDPTHSQVTEGQSVGIALAKAYGKEMTVDPLRATPFASWVKEPFPTYSFSAIWDLIQTQQWIELKILVKDKIIVLRPETNNASLPQIQLLNAALTNSWLQPIGTETQAIIVLFIAFSTAWIFLKFPNWKGGTLVLGLMGLSIATAVFLQSQLGLIFPLIGPVLAISCSTLSIGLLHAKAWKTQTSIHIQTLELNLSKIQKDLSLKEQKARSLMESLEEAKLAKQESTDMLKQLEFAQAEIEKTRQQFKEVEAELLCLRNQTAAIKTEPTPLIPDLEALSIECKDFGIITKDPHLLKVFSDIKKAAKSHNPILLLGETGTGKEVFAKAAHRLSDRERRPFIPVNMAAIRPELFESELFGHVKGAFTGAVGGKGYVEAAEGGTLFLDEMGELSLDLQAKLLRLLENHTFNRVGEAHTRQANVRILIATNRDLKHEVEQGRFREDLYYRLRSIVLLLPALRERIPEDRRLLAEYFLQQCADKEHRSDVQLNQEAMNTLISYSWPGNIRELKQTLSQAVSLAESPMLTKVDLRLDKHPSMPHQSDINPTPKPPTPKKSQIRDDATILTALRKHHFDMGATAQALSCDRSTITQRLKGLGYEALVKSKGDFSLAAKDLADDESLENIVEQKLREYDSNLLPRRKRYPSVEDAINDCRRRFKNLPDRYFPSVEILIRSRFSAIS